MKKKKSPVKKIIVWFFIMAAVFVTVQFTQQRQTIDQRASEGEVPSVNTTNSTTCVPISMQSYTVIPCQTGGINTLNFSCTDGYQDTLGGAACYDEEQLVAFAKSSCEARASCNVSPTVPPPLPSYPTQE